MKKLLPVFFLILIFTQCSESKVQETKSPAVVRNVPFYWRNATVYFLLTDRFYNGNPDNDLNFGRNQAAAKLRGFEGGDIKGITLKINEGYFDRLGITAIWLTPIVEQIHGGSDEGTGVTYGYHGYWAKDWTRLDPNFGTEEELLELVDTAHQHGIRILLDVVLNHTGPVTDKDPAWPAAWVREDPTCTYTGYATTVECTLVDNLPDIRTDRDDPVDLPPSLKSKWEQEGRLEQEEQALDEFFNSNGYPRAPRFYLIKWLSDYVRKYGIDGFRVDTAKHTEAEVWEELKKQAAIALNDWKKNNSEKKLDDNDFYMVGEVYGFGAGGERAYDYGDKKVDFFKHGFESLINFAFKYDATGHYDQIFSKYDDVLQGESLESFAILNYLTSHDDGDPFDKIREKSMEAGTKLLLAPGAAQIYYGDESNRPLIIEGAEGDAHLRSFMNWQDIETDSVVMATVEHWAKLGRFRKNHPSVGDGKHQKLQDQPYIFSRKFSDDTFTDLVLVALEVTEGDKSISVYDIFPDGTLLHDYYSGQTVTVQDGKVNISTNFNILLLAEN
jgi:alpha-amylase